ncbi:hypothetical protein F4778DRAFT_254317 [Xylariomycetidae sp. FL2044]|nr:hypothetical protein F4778DRAFT_254317 [Xylariomycetidae sp. FL2044]
MSDDESDEGKRAKKRKASRACDRCNSQHQPCDNATPKCSVCVRAGTDCTYNRPIRKRGPRSGYTGQNGERLWSIVLQAKPELEDLVLQILRRGTYSDTGTSNLDYYKNNENQTELVSHFNESRLGRFLQHGESPDLNLPPLDQELPPLTLHSSSKSVFAYPGKSVNSISSGTPSHQPNASLSPGAMVHTSIMNPHGAPQNPGDIYVQSEDIRKRAFNTAESQNRNRAGSISQGSVLDAGPERAMSTLTGPRSVAYGSNGSTNGYGEYGRVGNDQSAMQISHSRSVSQTGTNHPSTPLEHTPYESGLADTSRWLDSIPTDTLLNLGFMPGEGMTQDFHELCQDADPIETTPNASIDQNEDEEDVWRRLVMRGRFV